MALIFADITYYRPHDCTLFFDIRNLQILGPSLYNPEMSQHSSDLPISKNFSIILFWKTICLFISYASKTFKKLSHRPPL